MNPFFYTFVFFLGIAIPIGYFIYYAKTIDRNILKFLKRFLSGKYEIRESSSFESNKYHKYLGEFDANGKTVKVYTTNLEATLNRQIVLELSNEKSFKETFFLERNIYLSSEKEINPIGFEDFRIYKVPFTQLGSIQSSLGIMKNGIEQKKNINLFQMLEANGEMEKLLNIPKFRKIYGMNVINQFWKFYIEDKTIGFSIHWDWMKEIPMNEFENFLNLIINFKANNDDL